MNNKFLFIVGTRPEVIKTYPLINKLGGDVLFTGQHFDKNMSEYFFSLLNNQNISFINKNYSSLDNHTISQNIYLKIKEINPEIVFVQGDTNSTLYGAIATKYANKKLLYLEAGLRTKNLGQIEEYNRFIVSKLADLNFCNHENNVNNLINEGIRKNKIYLSGSTVYASLFPIVEKLNSYENTNFKSNFILLTLHRPENTDNFKKLFKTLNMLNNLNTSILFVAHPRVLNNINFSSLKKLKNIKIIRPLNYLDFIGYVLKSRFIISDSGGLQEESQILKKVLIIPRQHTERPELLDGYNFLAKNDNELKHLVKQAIENNLLINNDNLLYGNMNVIDKIIKKINSLI